MIKRISISISVLIILFAIFKYNASNSEVYTSWALLNKSGSDVTNIDVRYTYSNVLESGTDVYKDIEDLSDSQSDSFPIKGDGNLYIAFTLKGKTYTHREKLTEAKFTNALLEIQSDGSLVYVSALDKFEKKKLIENFLKQNPELRAEDIQVTFSVDGVPHIVIKQGK